MRVRLTPQAVDDVRDAVDHYDDVAGLGEEFLDQFDSVVERLLMFPNGAPPVEGFPGVRRARIRRFPYGAFYRLDGDDLVVLRVLHGRRDAATSLPS